MGLAVRPSERVRSRLAERGVDPSIDWFVVGGSGIGAGMVSDPAFPLHEECTVPLADLDLPAPAVEGHGRALVFGRLGATRLCIQTGRIHPYEGHPVQVCTAALSALVREGTGVVLTCAVGALSRDLHAGTVALICDQMNLFGPTPLVGPKFLDCSDLYDPSLRRRLQASAAACGLGPLPEVVYAHARGPQYETPAETRALSRLGGDVVGMSTTYEALAARAAGARVAGVAVVTNAAGADHLSHDEVQEVGARARRDVVSLLAAALSSPP